MNSRRLLFFFIFISCVKSDDINYHVSYHPSEFILNKYSDCIKLVDKEECRKASLELSYIGNFQIAQQLYELPRNSYNRLTDSLLISKRLSLNPAKQHILQKADEYRVLMINEAHHMPHHRLYTTSLLSDLYSKGYKYLGLEGLHETAEVLSSRGRPTLESGVYIKDPLYANMIRVAMDIGFQVFDYDIDTKSMKQREINQAKNIARVVMKDTSAKVLIHAGYGHIREDSLVLNGLMAHEFKKMTDIDPLTIDQSVYNYFGNSKFETKNKLYDSHDIDELMILCDFKSKEPYQNGKVDIILMHPEVALDKYSKRFLDKERSEIYHRKEIKISKKIRSKAELVLIYQKVIGEDYSNEVPVDIIEINGHDDKVIAFFPLPGHYKIIFQSDFEVLRTKEIKI